jgi:hypothetical protein
MNIVTRYMHKYLLAPTLDKLKRNENFYYAHILQKQVPY